MRAREGNGPPPPAPTEAGGRGAAGRNRRAKAGSGSSARFFPKVKRGGWRAGKPTHGEDRRERLEVCGLGQPPPIHALVPPGCGGSTVSATRGQKGRPRLQRPPAAGRLRAMAAGGHRTLGTAQPHSHPALGHRATARRVPCGHGLCRAARTPRARSSCAAQPAPGCSSPSSLVLGEGPVCNCADHHTVKSKEFSSSKPQKQLDLMKVKSILKYPTALKASEIPLHSKIRCIKI